MTEKKCAICGAKLDYFIGNNPEPIFDDSALMVCDDCFVQYVLPARKIFVAVRQRIKTEEAAQVGN